MEIDILFEISSSFDIIYTIENGKSKSLENKP